MIFQPGQKVICIDDKFEAWCNQFYVSFPVAGVTYTVRGIAPGIQGDNKTEDIAVYLEEVRNPCSSKPPHRERGFRPERFAPLEEVPPAVVEKEELVEA